MSQKIQSSKKSILVNFGKDLIYGSLSGAIAKTIIIPIQKIKLELYIQEEKLQFQNRHYKGFINCLYQNVKHQGFLNFWKYSCHKIIHYSLAQGILFGNKNLLQNISFKNINYLQKDMKFLLFSFLYGGIAGSFSLLFTYPLDFVIYRRPINPKINGIKSLYRGFSISVLGVFLYRSIYFGGYDLSKILIQGLSQQNKPSVLQKIVIAYLNTSLASTLAYPFDIIRKKLTINLQNNQQIKYKNIVDCSIQIYKKQGFTEFYKGNFHNLWRNCSPSIVLVLYDEFKYKFSGKRQQII